MANEKPNPVRIDPNGLPAQPQTPPPGRTVPAQAPNPAPAAPQPVTTPGDPNRRA